jgi:hypothetical protein
MFNRVPKMEKRKAATTHARSLLRISLTVFLTSQVIAKIQREPGALGLASENSSCGKTSRCQLEYCAGIRSTSRQGGSVKISGAIENQGPVNEFAIYTCEIVKYRLLTSCRI